MSWYFCTIFLFGKLKVANSPTRTLPKNAASHMPPTLFFRKAAEVLPWIYTVVASSLGFPRENYWLETSTPPP